MKLGFERLDPGPHDASKAAEIAYGADGFIMPLVFGRGPAGAGRMACLIAAGGNAFGREYAMVATADGEVAGVSIGYTGREKDAMNKAGPDAYARCLGVRGIVRMAFAMPVMIRVLTGRVEPDDFYVSVVAVDPSRRGGGVGTYLVENVLAVAREKGCRRAILDVSVENPGAIRFYERLGFRRSGRKRLIPLWDKVGTYTMTRELKKGGNP